MRYSFVIVLCIVILNTFTVSAQDRLHTADALEYAISQERQLELKTVLGDNESLCDGAFIDESNCRAFRIDLNKSIITLTKYSLGYEDDNWRLRNSKSYSVVINRSVCTRLSWLYNLAVSTSSPQNPPFVMDGEPCSFVFKNMIADWNCNGSYSLIELSRKVCNAVESANPAALNALKDSIEHLINDYKQFASLEVVSDSDVNYIGVGSLMGPFSVRVSLYPNAVSAIDEKTVRNTQLIFEEAIAQNINDFSERSENVLPMQVIFEISEADESFYMNVRYCGDSFDPTEKGDDISASIIRSLAKDCKHTFDKDGNHLRIKLK